MRIRTNRALSNRRGNQVWVCKGCGNWYHLDVDTCYTCAVDKAFDGADNKQQSAWDGFKTFLFKAACWATVWGVAIAFFWFIIWVVITGGGWIIGLF